MKKTRALAVVAPMALALAIPAAASAHVTVQPPEAEKGGFAKLAFRTPNERDDAGTVKLEVTFPPEAPFAFFNVRAVPGWTSTVERATLPQPLEVFGRTINEAVSKVTWEGGTIPPGGFEEFEVSVGPLPEDADQLVFKALQTYSSGEVVRWIEVREPGAAEDPEHPAPVLELADAEQEDANGESSGASATSRRTSTVPTGSPPSRWR
jgi:periplasmic copper chaperone A